MRAISWNLAHGRDFPPNAALRTLRSRLLRVTERDATHAQVNRPLLEEFATALARDPWEIALLQEAPPRWLAPLCRRMGATGALALTSRNLLAPGRTWIAERNPDLIASNEGGSNQLLVRPPWRVVEVRRLTLTWIPERRRLLWALLERPDSARLAVATLHATARMEAAAARDVELAAERAIEWAGGHALLLGGDLNLRPRGASRFFDRLDERFGLGPPTADGSVDHLFARRAPADRPRLLPDAWRELPGPNGRKLRLSDHPALAIELGDAVPGSR